MNIQHSSYPNQKDWHRAFTLTELAIVLGVVGFVIGAIWIAANNVKEEQRIKQALEEIQVISQGVISLQAQKPFSPGGTYEDVTPWITAGIVPAWAITSPSTAVSPWGQPLGIGLADYKRFLISLTNLPLDACIALLVQGTSCTAGQATCPTSIQYGVGVVGGWNDAVIPVTPAQANADCANGVYPNNGIEFWYTL